LSTTSYVSKGISPETDNPQPKEPESSGGAPSAPTEISMEEYHQVADKCMDTIVAKLEQLQEAREDVDVEYSVSSYPLHHFFLISNWKFY
jgi:frataxin